MVQVTTQQEQTTAPYCDEIPDDELASYLQMPESYYDDVLGGELSNALYFFHEPSQTFQFLEKPSPYVDVYYTFDEGSQSFIVTNPPTTVPQSVVEAYDAMPGCEEIPSELRDGYIEIPTLDDMVGEIYYDEPSAYQISASPYAYMGEPTYYDINNEEPSEMYMLYSTPETEESSEWEEGSLAVN